MNILGISAFYHDSAAAVLSDGELVAAAQEERFSRRKHDPAFPKQAIEACLAQAGLTPRDIGMVAFYEKPFTKLERVLDTTMAIAPAGRRPFTRTLPSWFTERLRVEELVREQLGFEGRFVYAGHHESHAASAFFVSPFDEAATLTTDGVGEWTTNAIGMGRGNRLEMLEEIRFPHSLGLLYSAFTQYLGFRVNNGEYKVMGLAPYGQPRFVDIILNHLIELKDDGAYRLRLEHFEFLGGESTIGPSFPDLFGVSVRAPEAELTQAHMDLARSVQAVTEQVVDRQVRHARELTGARHLCMAGGVALNSVANGKVVASGVFDEVYIQPAAGDAGGALGAALVAWHHVLDRSRTVGRGDAMSGACLGPEFDPEQVDAAVEAEGLTGERLGDDELFPRVAELLATGHVVGWFQGRMEFGPRALGNRSILADPRNPDMQPIVNARIKFREGFRPFAPSITAEDCSAWFDLDRPSPYMLLVVPIAEARRRQVSERDARREGLDLLMVERSEIPAVTHVDHSARVQTVDAQTHPRFHRLIRTFGDRTGCPILLNTSFNLRGEPMVCTPGDAARTFLASGMDAVVLNDVLVMRPAGAEPTGVRPPIPPQPRIVTESHLRTFGVGGGALLGLLAALQGWWGHPWLAIALTLPAAMLAAGGLLKPLALATVEAPMSRFGAKLGHFNAGILLGIIYLGIITPLGMLRRVVSGDPLHRDSAAGWTPMTSHHDDPGRYDRMY